MAVTEGFEPSVALATPAFEAGTFGRSDTSPSSRVANPSPLAKIRVSGTRRPGVRVRQGRLSSSSLVTSASSAVSTAGSTFVFFLSNLLATTSASPM